MGLMNTLATALSPAPRAWQAAQIAGAAALAEAEGLVTLHEQEIAATTKRITELEAPLDDQAAAALDGNAAAEKTYQATLSAIAGAKSRLAKLHSALRVARRNVAELRLAQSRATSAEQIKKIARLCDKRSKEAVALETAIADLVAAWKASCDTIDRIRTTYPGGAPAGALLQPQSLAQAIEQELYRVGGNPPLGGGQIRKGAPTVPGARCVALQFTHAPEGLPKLVDQVASANAYLIRILNGEPPTGPSRSSDRSGVPAPAPAEPAEEWTADEPVAAPKPTRTAAQIQAEMPAPRRITLPAN